MFENAEWIAMEDAHNAPWYGKPFENEDVVNWYDDPAYSHLEYGSVVFRHSFMLEEQVGQAYLAICGLGFYEVWINGKKPDDRRVLAPIVSDYCRYVRYDTYDITPLLKNGKNLIAVEICGGWYSGRKKFWGWQQIFYGNPRLIVQLDGTYESRKQFSTVTEKQSWKAWHGTVLKSCIYDGEEIDLNRLPDDWITEEYDDNGWKQPVWAEAPPGKLVNDDIPPIRITKSYSPVSSWKLTSNDTVYDFAINGSGVPKLVVTGHKGDQITLHFSEFIFPDGTLNEESCSGGGSLNTDSFILTGKENEICQPRFTWHGYRYCKISCSSPDIKLLSVEKLELHSDIQITGSFLCSNEELNRLHRAYKQTQISCLIGEPLDCNQRGERKGWTGDAAVSAEEAVYNFDMKRLYAAYLQDMRRERHPERKTFGIICPNHKSFFDGTSIDWAIAFPIIMCESYGRYGDIRVLEENWDALCEYVAYYDSLREKDGMLPVRYTDKYTGTVVSPAWFGDWCTEDYFEGTEKVAFDCGTEDHRQNPSYLGSVFYAWIMRLTEQIAHVLRKEEIVSYYEDLRKKTIEGIRAKHYDWKNHILGSGGQFLLTIGLAEHIVPEEERDMVFANLLKAFEEKEYHATFGIYGQRLIGEVLRSFGREDILYHIMTQPGYPGFMHMIEKGQTTIAEHLCGHDDTVWGSGCHTMFAAADANLHRIFGGITVNRFDTHPVTIAPYHPSGITFAEDNQKLKEGDVSVRWECIDSVMDYRIKIPDGLSAFIKLSYKDADLYKIVKGGTYRFKCKEGVFSEE